MDGSDDVGPDPGGPRELSAADALWSARLSLSRPGGSAPPGPTVRPESGDHGIGDRRDAAAQLQAARLPGAGADGGWKSAPRAGSPLGGSTRGASKAVR